MKRILDIGCGTGYRTSKLKTSPNIKVVGIDISKQNIAQAEKRYLDIQFRVMSAEKILYPDNYFDEINAVDVLEHIDNLKLAIKEIVRVLKVGGKFNILVPGEKSEEWLLKIRPTYFQEIHHVRVFKSGELEKMFNKMGLFMKKHQRCNFLQHLELFYFFKTQNTSLSQLEIGNWRNNWLSILVHATVSMFDPYWVFHSPLIFIPLWVFTVPLGFVINFFGNRIMPKSIYYEFIKT